MNFKISWVRILDKPEAAKTKRSKSKNSVSRIARAYLIEEYFLAISAELWLTGIRYNYLAGSCASAAILIKVLTLPWLVFFLVK